MQGLGWLAAIIVGGLAGWIASRVDPQMREPEANLAYLRQHLGAPLLADIPWQAQPDARVVPVQLPLAWQ